MELTLKQVPGIGPKTVESLHEAGVTTAKGLVALGVDGLAALPGFGPARAATVIRAAQALLPAKGAGKVVKKAKPEKKAKGKAEKKPGKSKKAKKAKDKKPKKGGEKNKAEKKKTDKKKSGKKKGKKK